jgi:hypothetical protein
MTTLEIVLLIAGAAVLVIGYALPVRMNGNGDGDDHADTDEQIHEKVSREVEASRGRLEGIVDETVDYAMDKTERSLERVTNEKMMALSDYSNTIMDDINKNHKEVLFMYDMLHDKHENLKSTVSEAAKTEKKVKEATREAIEAQQVAADNEEEADDAGNAVSEEREDTVNETGTGDKKEFTPFVPEHIRVEDGSGDSDEQEGTEPVIFKPVSESAQPQKDNAEGKKEQPGVGKAKGTEGGRRKKQPPRETESGKEPVLQFAQGMQSRNNNEKILKLHKSGRSNTAIAKELGLGIGEVKLVIDLYESK